MKQLDRLLEVLDALARWVAMALATIIIAILFVQIFYRYVLNTSIVWSEEVATWCLVWLVFLGSAAIMRRWEHVHIPMLIKRQPPDQHRDVDMLPAPHDRGRSQEHQPHQAPGRHLLGPDDRGIEDVAVEDLHEQDGDDDGGERHRYPARQSVEYLEQPVQLLHRGISAARSST